MRPDEYLFAHLGDIYVVCHPERVSAIYKLLGQALEENARIQMHLGKTQVWNRGGHMPPGCDSMQVGVQRVDPHEGPSHPIKDIDAQGLAQTPLVSARLAECVVAPPLLRQCPGHVFVAWNPAF